jgi:myo-inositol-1(or 4)-monophosphatase
MFTAVRGEGAFLNRKKIRVSRAGTIGKSLLVTGFPYYIHERFRRVLGEFNRVVRAARGIRRDGSAAIDLAFVACGRFDGFFERDLKIWDVSGGDLLVTEAGGRVTDYRAGRSGLPSEIVATNGKIHRQLLDLVK